MHPILFVLETGAGARPIASFGVMLATAMILASFIGVRAASRAGIHWSDGLSAASILCGAGLAGGYLLQIVVETFRSGSVTSAIATGGLTFYGAPIMGTLALAIAAKPLGFSFLRLADSAIGAVPLAHALGRIGCFLGGCCYGEPWDGPFAVAFHHPMAAASIDPIPRHPVQLYEAMMLFVVALGFALVPPRAVGDGRRAMSYVGVYAVVRLIAERFRGDAERGFVAPGVSTSDAISVVALAVAIAFLARAPRARVAS